MNILLPTIATIHSIINAKYLIIPCVAVTVMPLLNTFTSCLDKVKKSLLILSNVFWYFLLEKIVRYIKNKTHKLLLIILNGLIQELNKQELICEECSAKLCYATDFDRDFPLYADADYAAEIRDLASKKRKS